jgi:hypothetical protein
MMMGIFGKKKPQTRTCDVCDAPYTLGESPSHVYSHIVKISSTEPSWLPGNLRAVAHGEYTFRCDRCNSFPSIKWPSDAGAYAGMSLHLAAVHNAGMVAGSGGALRGSVNFDMIPVG